MLQTFLLGSLLIGIPNIKVSKTSGNLKYCVLFSWCPLVQIDIFAVGYPFLILVRSCKLCLKKYSFQFCILGVWRIVPQQQCLWVSPGFVFRDVSCSVQATKGQCSDSNWGWPHARQLPEPVFALSKSSYSVFISFFYV